MTSHARPSKCGEFLKLSYTKRSLKEKKVENGIIRNESLKGFSLNGLKGKILFSASAWPG